VTRVPAIRQARRILDSGAVVVARRHTLTPAVTAMLSFDAGSVFDPAERPGLAAFTARMIDRGTPRLSADALAEAIEQRGATIDVTSNRQCVAISLTCLIDDFQDMLTLATDMARTPSFPDDQIELRRHETLTRIAQDAENTAMRASARVFERLYGDGHPYAHAPRGTAESIGALTRADLEAFHAARVRPSRLAVAVVGDIDEAEACDVVAQALSTWSDTPAAPDAIPTPTPPTTRDVSRIDVPGKAQADIAYGLLGPGRLDPEYYAFWVMNTVLGQYGLGGRLGENIRERHGMAYYASSSYDAHRIPGPLIARAGVDPSNVERALSAIDLEIDRVAREGVTRAERDAAVRFLIGSIPRMVETNAGMAQFLIGVEQFGLGDDFDRRLPDLLSGVTHDAVNAAAASLASSRAVVAIAGPGAA